MGSLQPSIAVNGQFFGFWGGMPGVSQAQREAFYAALGSSTDAVFPIAFSAEPGLASGVVSGSIGGFYRLVSFKEPPVVER
jgi:hypothetical protein